MNPPASTRRRAINWTIFFAVLGPGIITAMVDNDAGGISTYSAAGANFGNAFLWSLIPIMLALILVQEMSNRMGVVTGKGLAALIREKFGVKITFYLVLALLVTNFGNVLAEFAGIAASSQILGLKASFCVPAGAIFVWLMAVKGSYKTVERVFLFACLFYALYIVTGFLAKPDWGAVARDTAIPTFSFNTAWLAMLVGIIGTTIAPWMQFYQQASVVEKRIPIEQYRYSKYDTIIGGIVVTVVAYFIVVVCSATLFNNGVQIDTAAQAAEALAPLTSQYASILFAIGLLSASLFAASILPLSTAYTVCEALGWEAAVDRKFAEAPQFYLLYTLLILFGAGIAMIPGINLFSIMLVSQIINGVLLPIIILFILLLVNDREIMGEYRNGPITNTISVIAMILVGIAALVMVVFTMIDLFR
ncbi:MAG: Nramp family divalent metal transporter [Candidatus Brocadiia bacterium]